MTVFPVKVSFCLLNPLLHACVSYFLWALTATYSVWISITPFYFSSWRAKPTACCFQEYLWSVLNIMFFALTFGTVAVPQYVTPAGTFISLWALCSAVQSHMSTVGLSRLSCSPLLGCFSSNVHFCFLAFPLLALLLYCPGSQYQYVNACSCFLLIICLIIHHPIWLPLLMLMCSLFSRV